MILEWLYISPLIIVAPVVLLALFDGRGGYEESQQLRWI